MSTKTINFTNMRNYMFGLSILLIIGGIVGMIVLGGFNLSIDFQAGLSQRVQIADEGFSLTVPETSGEITFDVNGSTVVLTLRDENGVAATSFTAAAYPTIGDLVGALQGTYGVEAALIGPASASTDSIVTGLSLPYEISAAPVYVNIANADSSSFITIDAMREALSSMNVAQVQVVGDDYNQEFQIRAETESEGAKDELEADIFALLKSQFGDHSVVIKGSDYVGPKFSAALTTSSIILVIVALILIAIYIWVRFKLAYAISALTALAHDVLIMLGFIAVFRLEVSTTTIAAVLTIIGYSLNDTIVVFDRIRENTKGMKGSALSGIINTSITQSLSRTLITSLTTLLAVIPLFIFATGSIKLFALNLIVGIVVGTYSSIFIASPVLLTLMKRIKHKSDEHLGKTAEADEPVSAEPAKLTVVNEDVEIPSIERKKKGKRQTKK